MSLPPAPGDHPPRPLLTLRVGITGHRAGASLIESALPRVRTQIDGVLRACSVAAAKIRNADSDVFDAEAPRLVGVSCLASGSDQIFAHAVLAQGWRLDAVLPFAREEYARDFDNPESHSEFCGLLERAASVFEIADPRSEADASEAYETAGLVMLGRADLLIAVWDGEVSRGRGGTREIIDEALRRDVPVVWINTITQQAAALWHGDGSTLLPELETGAASPVLEDALVRALAPPGLTEAAAVGEAGRRLRAFLREREGPAPIWTLAYDLLTRLAARRRVKWSRSGSKLSSRLEEWNGFTASMPNGDLKDGLRGVLLQRFLWADQVADRAGRLDRGVYVASFGVVMLAVLFGALALWNLHSIAIVTGCLIVELLLACLILALTRTARKRGWHQRFLDARRLTEKMRQYRLLAPLGQAREGDLRSADVGERWTFWYARAAARELSLPHVRVTSNYLTTLATATLDHEVAPQLAYHRNNQTLHRRIDAALARWVERLLIGAALTCGCWIAAAALWALNVIGKPPPVLAFFSMMLPVCALAFAGIRARGDFAGSATRSAAAAQQMETLSEVLLRPGAGYRDACLRQLAVSEAIASEFGGWQLLQSSRPLTVAA